jgi:AcrR family transcriptional regulator
LRERKRADSRAATLECALRLFTEHGYDRVTVADICAAADIGRRTFFRYFASKEDLLVEPVRDMTNRLAASLAAAPASVSDEQALRLALTQLADDTLSHREYLVELVTVLRSAHTVHISPFTTFSDHEAQLARQLAARHGNPAAPDWRTRLIVARTVAAFRVWLVDLIDGTAADPRAHLDEVFNYR